MVFEKPISIEIDHFKIAFFEMNAQVSCLTMIVMSDSAHLFRATIPYLAFRRQSRLDQNAPIYDDVRGKIKNIQELNDQLQQIPIPQIGLSPEAEKEVVRELKSVFGVQTGAILTIKKLVFNKAQAMQALENEPAKEDVANITRLEQIKKIRNTK